MAEATFNGNTNYDFKLVYRAINPSSLGQTTGRASLVCELYLYRKTSCDIGKTFGNLTAYIDLPATTSNTGRWVSNFCTNKYVRIPFDNKYHKIGTIIEHNLPVNKNGNITTQFALTVSSDNPDMNFSVSNQISVGSVGDIYPDSWYSNIYYNSVSNKNKIYDVARDVGSDFKFTIEVAKCNGEHNGKSASVSGHRIRWYWGNNSDKHSNMTKKNVFGNIVNVHSDADDVLSNAETIASKDITLNIPLSDALKFVDSDQDMLIVEITTRLSIKGTISYVWTQPRYIAIGNLKIPDSFKPVIDSVNLSISNKNNTVIDDWGIALQGWSLPVAYMTAHNSVAESGNDLIYSISTNEKTIYSTSFTEENPFEGSTFLKAGSNLIAFSVIDRRGREAFTSRIVDVVKYNKPSLVLKSFYRCDQYGNIDTGGSYLYIEPEVNLCSIKVDNTEKNEVTSFNVKWKRKNDDSYPIDNIIHVENQANHYIVNPRFTKKDSYDVEVEIMDSLSQSAYVRTISYGDVVLLHFPPGGQCMGIGQYNTDRNTLKIGYDTYIKEKLVDDFIIGRGTYEASDGTFWTYEHWGSGKIELFGFQNEPDGLDFGSQDVMRRIVDIPKNKKGDYLITIDDLQNNSILFFSGSAGDNVMITQSVTRGSGDNTVNGPVSYSNKFNFTLKNISSAKKIYDSVDFSYHVLFIPAMAIKTEGEDGGIVEEEIPNGE